MRWFLALLGLFLVAIATPQAIAADTPAANPNDEATDFLFRLGMMEGHLLIGHDLLKAKQAALALPHFGHPVHEIYDDISGYLEKNKFPRFDKQLAGLEASAAAAPESADTEKQYQAVIATIHKARELTPATLRASLPDMIQICSDTIDAASGEFGEGLEQGKIASVVEYHDSKGYLEYVSDEIGRLSAAHPDVPSQSLLDRFKAVLAKAQFIVEPLLPDPTPRASLDAYRAIAAEAATVAKR